MSGSGPLLVWMGVLASPPPPPPFATQLRRPPPGAPLRSCCARRLCGSSLPAFVSSRRRRQQFQSIPAVSQEDLNPGEDWDADIKESELDALFDEFGEVVLADSKPTLAAAETDEDSEWLSLAVALAEAAHEVKAGEIKVLHVKPLVYWTRFFVIATAFSKPQIDAVRRRIRDVALREYNKTPRGDTKANPWTLLDFGDVVVHLFYPKERAYYNLEEFYGNAATIDLPFESHVTQ